MEQQEGGGVEWGRSYWVRLGGNFMGRGGVEVELEAVLKDGLDELVGLEMIFIHMYVFF